MKRIFGVLIFFTSLVSLTAQTTARQKPVTPSASSEAVQLLDFLYELSGNKTLTGQHDQPIYGSAYYQRVYEVTGTHPVVKGMDFGFSERNTLDGINFRQRIVDETIEYHKEGAIITLMWHAVPPTMDEPVTFREGIQSKLTDAQWNELVTPGTALHLKWQSQVDVIAFFLKQIQEENIPVIWRPYHEMNGAWFWWGKKEGENGYKKLYRMLFERLVHYHKINNLLWVFNGNELSGEWMSPYENFYPGHDYVDILATDVYRKNYQQKDYDELLKLAEGKPIALGEVGKIPTAKILEKQAQWVWFMTWVDQVFHSNSIEELKNLYGADNTVTREDLQK